MKPHVQNEETSVQTLCFSSQSCVRVFILFLGRPPPPTFSLSVCTFFIGFVIGREAHAIYSYIGAATINEQGTLHLHFCFLFLLTSTHTRGRSANE